MNAVQSQTIGMGESVMGRIRKLFGTRTGCMSSRFREHTGDEKIFVPPEDGNGVPIHFTRDEILENVVLTAVNRERKANQLRTVLHFDLLDMAGRYMLVIPDRGVARPLPVSVLDALGISDVDLRETASRNTLRKFGIVMVLTERRNRASQSNVQWWTARSYEETKIDSSAYYTVTNRMRFFGSSLLLIPEVLESLGEKARMDYFVMPAGVSEFIIFRDEGKVNRRALKKHVHAVFQIAFMLDPENALTDSVYHYSRRTKTLSIV